MKKVPTVQDAERLLELFEKLSQSSGMPSRAIVWAKKKADELEERIRGLEVVELPPELHPLYFDLAQRITDDAYEKGIVPRMLTEAVQSG